MRSASSSGTGPRAICAERLFALALEPVDGGDVGVVERREEPRLALEPREAVGVGGEGGREELERDVATEFGVARAVYLTHAPGADLVGHLVVCDPANVH